MDSEGTKEQSNRICSICSHLIALSIQNTQSDICLKCTLENISRKISEVNKTINKRQASIAIARNDHLQIAHDLAEYEGKANMGQLVDSLMDEMAQNRQLMATLTKSLNQAQEDLNFWENELRKFQIPSKTTEKDEGTN